MNKSAVQVEEISGAVLATPKSAGAGALTRLQAGARKLVLFSGLEVLSRALQACVALIIVRTLSKDHYAWYAIANALQGTLAMFSLTGAGAGLMSLGGERIADPLKMGEIVAAARRLRLWLMLTGAPIAIPIYGSMLIRNGCSTATTVCLIAGALAVLWMEIQRHMCSSPLGLAREYNFLQKAEVLEGAVRLLLISALVVTIGVRAETVLFASLIAGAFVITRVMVPRVGRYVAPAGQVTPEIQKSFTRLAVAGFPTNLTYLLDSQLAMLLVAWIGNSHQVADLGALSRIALVFAVPSAFISKLILPRFATINEPRQLLREWVMVSAIGAACGWLMFGVLCVFRKEVLWVLGTGYANLGRELVLYAAYLSFAFVCSTASAIIWSKGWLRYSWIRPAIVVLCQAAAVVMFEVDDVSGAIWLMIAGSLGNALTDAILLVRGFGKRGSVA